MMSKIRGKTPPNHGLHTDQKRAGAGLIGVAPQHRFH